MVVAQFAFLYHRFESSHWHIFTQNICLLSTELKKAKIKKKSTGMAHFKNTLS